MDKVFSQEIIRLLAMVGIVGIGLMALLGNFVGKLKGSFKPYQKATIIYLLVSLAICGLIGLLGSSLFASNASYAYGSYQVAFLLMGALHVFCLYKYLAWSGEEKMFWLELLFTVVVAAGGFVAFSIAYKWLNRSGLHFLMASSVVFVPLSLLFYQTFLRAVAIPPKVFKQWFYPVGTELEEPDDSKLRNMLVISFEFQKKSLDPHITNFRAKAPNDMAFGQLFYYFLNDYNDRHPNGKIELMHDTGEAYGWIFYKKPRWYTLITAYIDPEKTFYTNHVRENDVIVCSRSSDLHEPAVPSAYL